MITQIITYHAKSKKEITRVEGLLVGLGIKYNMGIQYTSTKQNRVKRVEFEIISNIDDN